MMKELNLVNSGLRPLVDDEDFERCSVFNWYLSGSESGIYRSKYISDTQETIKIKLANFIMKDYTHIYDHKDRNFLNNRKDNFRICNNSQNGINRAKWKQNATSKYKGVSKRDRIMKPWRASIMVNGKYINLGSFSTEEKAAHAYNIAAKQYFGEFAVLNKIMQEK